MRRISTLSALVLAVLTAAAPTAAAAQPAEKTDLPASAHSYGSFDHYESGTTAVTYDPSAVPVGATAGFLSRELPGEHTGVTAALRGLRPDRDYGAHVHTEPCGRTGSAAGPHFQQEEAPEGVSGDPAYANPHNEVWLDFHTDEAGNAVTASFGDWNLERAGKASMVIHEHHTRTAPGEAGEAGDRLGCLTVEF
ncbi:MULTISPECIES: superoxide dismutase family protein [unclassified Actinopolyspora]|uniref:superoxide dismutase family protein n=1 Tax=unclassified Actinopolyspora TaxID=2639451 RepID=UPI0013F60CD8|nr:MULTISPECIES: superoxide dismutase family protein [unclassified Actinopolyspora]NHD16387.1 superoxide dismutase family protein [Actinopolyspora sp. BKK2]NHE75750.1 superoxide dismutase family protein [Actinopolyspora sp. BKK1]